MKTASETDMNQQSGIGAFVKQVLEERSMKQSDLAELTGIQRPIINDLIKGKRSMTAETAVLFEVALGISADYLMGIQTEYDLKMARNNPKMREKIETATDWSILKSCASIPVLKSKGIINDGDLKSNVRNALEVFGVENGDEIQSLYDKEQDSLFRKSSTLTTDDKALFTWKYLSINQSKQHEINKPFSKDSIDKLIEKLNEIFRENSDTMNRTREAVENCGIKLIHEEKAGQVPVDGMSFWKGKNPTIVYTLRMGTIDNFAFTIMHELGHLKLHLERGGEEMINVYGADLDDKEREANEFADNSFIAQEQWTALMNQLKAWNPFTVHVAIKKVADEIGVNPQILYGRYMHETGLYNLRRVFETEIK